MVSYASCSESSLATSIFFIEPHLPFSFGWMGVGGGAIGGDRLLSSAQALTGGNPLSLSERARDRNFDVSLGTPCGLHDFFRLTNCWTTDQPGFFTSCGGDVLLLESDCDADDEGGCRMLCGC